MQIEKKVEEGYRIAIRALECAYAPYSQYRVGCALKLVGDDQIYSGCNVENIVFPAGICAERAAISSLFGKRESTHIKLEWLLVVTDSDLGDAPCGICQQVIAEFADPDLPIYISNLQKILACHTLREIRPVNYHYPHQKDRYGED